MRNPRELRVRCFDDCMIDINQYLYNFMGANTSDNIGEMNLNEILLKSMTN